MRRIPFRWCVAFLLFLSTTLNYISRQTLSEAAPFLEQQLHINSRQYSQITFWFMIAYAVTPIFAGRLLDRFGTKLGLALAVIWWSLVGMLHAFARTVTTFKVLRALLAIGEGVNWPGATKAVAEWFPAAERSLAVGFFDSGSSIGAFVAATAILPLIERNWRFAFLVTGALGFVWLFFWLKYYGSWQTSPHVSGEERNLLAANQGGTGKQAGQAMPWTQLLRFKEVWGVIAGRTCSDAVWWFLVFWLTKFLVQSRGVSFRLLLLTNWIPYICADLGNFGGGGTSSWLARRGFSLTKARRSVLIVSGAAMTIALPGALLHNTAFSLTSISLYALFYGAFTTIVLALPSDLFDPQVVGSVAGIAQTGAGIGGALFQLLGGYLVARLNSYSLIFCIAALLSLLGLLTTVILVPRVELLGRRGTDRIDTRVPI